MHGTDAGSSSLCWNQSRILMLLLSPEDIVVATLRRSNLIVSDVRPFSVSEIEGRNVLLLREIAARAMLLSVGRGY